MCLDEKRRWKWPILADRVSGSGGENQRDDQTVETQDLSEDEDQDHTDVETRLLGCTANTSVTNNTDRKTGSQTRQTDAQTSSQMVEAPFLI